MTRPVGIAVLTLGLLLGACGRNAARDDNRVRVVASFYPLAEMAERIGGEHVEVVNLTPPGVEPHDLELTTDQLDQVLDADVVLHLGAGFQPALEDALGRTDAEVVEVLAADERDPHVWLDPARWAEVTAQVGDALRNVVDGTDMSGSAVRYRRRLETLHRDFRSGLAGCERDLIVTSHAAFGALADRYGLRQEAVSGISPEAEPAPDRIAELADLIRREGVTTIFTETLVSTEVADTIARETGVRVRTLDPIEGLTSEQLAEGDDYETQMRSNLDALREGLGCRSRNQTR